MNVVIVEDERPAAERLETSLKRYRDDIDVVARLQTLAETSEWLATHAEPDLIFLDVHLSDGIAIDLFRQRPLTCPVIFTTAYDAYALDAFECNSIDYLLKPIRGERLAQAMDRYDRLRSHFAGELVDALESAIATQHPEYKRRLLVQRGNSYLSLDEKDLRYAYSSQKTTFLVDASGHRYISSEALTSLENALDPSDFFRLNRKYLARIDAVRRFQSAGRGRILVYVMPDTGEPVYVSQEKASRFRAWMEH